MHIKNIIFDFTKTVLTLFRVLKNIRYTISPLPKTKSDTIVILGTGPSLKNILNKYFESIKKYDTLAVNKFCMREEYIGLSPRHYVLLDALFSTKKLPAEHIKLRDEVFNALVERTSWEMYLYMPSNTDMKEEINAFFAKNMFIHVVYFSMTTVEGLKPVSFKLYEKGYGTPYAGNVLVSALLLALNMNYKQLILTGADLSMHSMAAVNFDNQLCLEEMNFYDKKNECKPLNQSVHDYYFKIARTFEAFQMLKGYADFKGASVVNCSTESFIDAFEKREADDVFSTEA